MTAYTQEAILQGIEDGSLDAFFVLLGAYDFAGGNIPSPLPAPRAAQLPMPSVNPVHAEAGDTFFRSTLLGAKPVDSLALFHSTVELIESEGARLGEILDGLECVPDPETVAKAAEVLRELGQFACLAHSDLMRAADADNDGEGETLH